MSLNPNLARRTKSALMLGTLTIALVVAVAVPNFARAHTTVNPLMGSSLSGHGLVNQKAQFYHLIHSAQK